MPITVTYRSAPFSITLTTPNPYFKVTPICDTKYLSNSNVTEIFSVQSRSVATATTTRLRGKMSEAAEETSIWTEATICYIWNWSLVCRYRGISHVVKSTTYNCNYYEHYYCGHRSTPCKLYIKWHWPTAQPTGSYYWQSQVSVTVT